MASLSERIDVIRGPRLLRRACRCWKNEMVNWNRPRTDVQRSVINDLCDVQNRETESTALVEVGLTGDASFPNPCI